MHPASVEACLHRLGLTMCQLGDADDVGHDDGAHDDGADDGDYDHAESDWIG